MINFETLPLWLYMIGSTCFFVGTAMLLWQSYQG